MLSRSSISVLALFFVPAILAAAPELSEATRLRLAAGGNTNYTVVYAATAGPAELYAVQELTDHLEKVTEAKFRVATDAERVTGPRILVGPGVMSKAVLGKKTVENLGEEEYVIRVVGRDLLLVGGRPRGTLYAVYDFLDSNVGVRWWAPGATHIPKQSYLTVGNLNIKKKPAFEYRDVFLNNAWNADWAARNRLNGRVLSPPGSSSALMPPDAKHGGGISYCEGFVHTFAMHIPSAKYFDDHPDWFPLIDGKRVKGYHQLCLTNPEVLDFMVKQVKAYLAQNPHVKIISVSQNDCFSNCQCPNCRKVDDEEGSPSGSLLRFVNAVAERLEPEFPNVYVDTLAYQYSRRPPKHVRPRHNVIVRLCSIECSFAQPLDAPANRGFAEDLSGWAAITKNIYIWDYIANFSNFFRPHPNLRVLGPNVRLFARNNVKGIFEQGSYFTPSGEMEELRSWVLARLLWDPSQDDQALIDEFVNGYYEKASPFIRAYINLIHDAAEKSDYAMNCGAGDPSPYVTVGTMSRAESLFQQAEAAVAGEPEVLTRVQRAHMPIQCMWLIHYDEWLKEAKEQGYSEPARFQDILEAFSRQVDSDRITRLSEGREMSNFVGALRHKEMSSRIRGSGPNNVPWEVYDGDPKTTWDSRNPIRTWIQKDFGKLVKIKAVHTDCGAQSTDLAYIIEGSDDGTNFKVLVSERKLTNGKGDDLFSMPVEVRFVRTTLLKAQEEPGVNITIAEQVIETE